MKRSLLVLLVGSMLTIVGCGGELVVQSVDESSTQPTPSHPIDDPNDPDPDPNQPPDPTLPPPSCDEDFTPGPRPLKRLTQEQYKNTIRIALDGNESVADNFVVDEKQGSFAHNTGSVGEVHVEQYMRAAETIATTALENDVETMRCADGVSEDECLRSGIARTGRVLWRRPLTSSELDELTTTIQSEHDTLAAQKRVALTALLQSPFFLYHVEIGSEEGATELTPHELASKLSYFLWNEPPDETLSELADQDALTPETLEAQALRMMEDPRASTAREHFFLQWLHLERLEVLSLDRSLQESMLGEVRASLQARFEAGDATLDDLLFGPMTFVDGALAQHLGYSLEASLDPMEFHAIEPPDGRSGLLGQAAWLTAQQDTVHRGLWLFEEAFCSVRPAIDPELRADISAFQNDPDNEGLNPRELVEKRFSIPRCSGCHLLFESSAFAFLPYDDLGRYRETFVDETDPIDTAGELLGTDVNGPFSDKGELLAKLAESEQVKSCFVKQMALFAHGFRLAYDDPCALEDLTEKFIASGGDIDSLIVSIVVDPSFSTVRP